MMRNTLYAPAPQTHGGLFLTKTPVAAAFQKHLWHAEYRYAHTEQQKHEKSVFLTEDAFFRA